MLMLMLTWINQDNTNTFAQQTKKDDSRILYQLTQANHVRLSHDNYKRWQNIQPVNIKHINIKQK